MKAIHLLRKPCTGSTVVGNVLQNGAGGLNIDACRIDGAQSGLCLDGHGRNGDLTQAMGRWPANLILQHLSTCHCVGSKVVRANGHFPAARPSGSQVAGPSGHRGQEALSERYLSSENVPKWACAEGCPVAAFDEHSGVCRSTMYGRLPADAVVRNPGKGKSDIRFIGIGGVSNVYSDTGGASRFFKQVVK